MTAILDLETFIREARFGQPLHRDVLGQDSVTAVLSEWDPNALQLAPQLVKARAMEVAQRHSPQPHYAPPTMNLGPGSSGNTMGMAMNMTPQPPTGGDKE